jgi:signal peptidase I
MSSYKHWKSTLFGLVALFLVGGIFLFRAFSFEFYQIPSQGMLPTLDAYDYVKMNRRPVSSFKTNQQWKLNGETHPKVNDIVSFIHSEFDPGKQESFSNPKNIIYRIVAGPGMSVTLQDGILTIDQESLGNKELLRKQHTIYTLGNKEGLEEYKHIEESNADYTRIVILPVKSMNSYLYSPLVKDFPEVTCPSRGVPVDLKGQNTYFITLMKLLIQRESGKDLIINKQGNLVMEGEVLDTWTPADDYWFMMGDNRENAIDSRFMGFIPDQNITSIFNKTYQLFKKKDQ